MILSIRVPHYFGELNRVWRTTPAVKELTAAREAGAGAFRGAQVPQTLNSKGVQGSGLQVSD